MKKCTVTLFLVVLIMIIGYYFQLYYYNQYYAIRLTKAIEDNDLKQVEYLLDRRGNIDAKTHVICLDCIGDVPALHTAAELCDYEVVKLLIEHGADVNNTNAVNDFSPLNRALSCNNTENRLEIAKYLIDNGADINYRSYYGNGENALAATLRLNYNQYSLETDKEQLEFIIWLIEQGGNVENAGGYGNLIFYAAVNNNVLIVKYLIENEFATIDLQNDSGYTALMFSSRSGAKEVVEYLLEKGSNKELMNKYGQTALDIARKNENEEIITILNE